MYTVTALSHYQKRIINERVLVKLEVSEKRSLVCLASAFTVVRRCRSSLFAVVVRRRWSSLVVVRRRSSFCVVVVRHSPLWQSTCRYCVCNAATEFTRSTLRQQRIHLTKQVQHREATTCKDSVARLGGGWTNWEGMVIDKH